LVVGLASVFTAATSLLAVVGNISVSWILVLVNTGQGASGGVQLDTMIGIAALLVGAGVAWLCFAAGVYFFTRTGREGMRIVRMEEEQRRPPRET
jgi:hypothetical protein